MLTAPTPMRIWPPLLTFGPIWNRAPPPVMVKARSVVLPAETVTSRLRALLLSEMVLPLPLAV